MLHKYMDFKKELRNFVEVWGERAQIIMCIEEMSELTKALCKYLRINDVGDISEEKRAETLENMKEEIADVSLLLDQMKYMFGFTDDEIEIICKQKIERSVKKLQGKKPKKF